ncbi:HEAT repeat domain-containing protein [Mycoplasma sp. P36-A1]|uniref:HEAT repeat domain-containing protein n=1 Tax=Mycoplasma sp. P36-A1 TaxID=3252900 RepID=UPI003C2E2264
MSNKNINQPNKRTSEQIKELSNPHKEERQLHDQAISTNDIIEMLKSNDEKTILKGLTLMELTRLDQDQPLVDQLYKLLDSDVVAIKAHSLWFLGEIGMGYYTLVYPNINKITKFLDDEKPELRVKAIHALARISTADFKAIEPNLAKIINMRSDNNPTVREAVAWAATKVASYNPDALKSYLEIIIEMLKDRTPDVRKQALQVFKEMAIQRPQEVAKVMNYLLNVQNNDENSMVSNEAKALVKYIDNHTKVNNYIEK